MATLWTRFLLERLRLRVEKPSGSSKKIGKKSDGFSRREQSGWFNGPDGKPRGLSSQCARVKGLGRTKSPEPGFLALAHIATLDRWALEAQSRRLAQSVYIGNGVVLCRVLGRYKFYVTASDVGFGAHLMLDGVWEGWLTVFMARLIKPGMTVVDVGANHGYYTVLFADLVGPEGRVAAIEPHPVTARLLRMSVDVNGFHQRVKVAEMAAMSADNARVTLHLPEGEPKNARIIDVGVDARPDRVSVKGGTIDRLLSRWSKIDFIKVDVEGAEEDAIMGMSGILERDRPRMLLEFNVGRGRDPAALIDRLFALYGEIRSVDFDSVATPVSREALLNPKQTEDWILYLAAD